MAAEFNKNPLLQNFNQAPFSEIDIDHFEEAFHYYIKQTRDEISEIVNQSEVPDFDNTIKALEFSGEKLERVAQIS